MYTSTLDSDSQALDVVNFCHNKNEYPIPITLSSYLGN